MKKRNFIGKNNKRDFGRNDYSREKPRVKFERFEKIQEVNLSAITLELSKRKVMVKGSVEKIVQTGGPTVFVVSDGTASLSLKGFVGPGERAYPEIEEGDIISSLVTIGDFQGTIEGEIVKISKLTDNEREFFLKKILEIQRSRAAVNPIPFLVRSQILDKLRDSFIKAATEIRLAIIQSRPIIVRHHNDTDGYSAGYALERAILPLIIKQQLSEKAAWEYFLRAPSAAPFYEIDDSIRDVALSLRNVAKFSNKMPLVIIADNGSTPEDLLGIKHGKVHGMEFIVIDHHFSEKDVISKEVLTHINPFLVGEDGACFSAGMLCSELARLINPVDNIEQIPAMAGLADRIDIRNPEVIEQYLKIAEKNGYSKELLMNISTVIDFVSSRIRFMEVREYIGVLFGEPRDRQKALIETLEPHIRKLKEKGLSISKSNAKTEKIGKTTLQSIEIDQTFPGFGFYPKPGMCVGMIHDDLQSTKGVTNLVTVGIMETAMTLRATDGSNFSVHELIKLLDEKSPESFVEGGGHKNAGSINFLPNKKDKIFQLLKKFIETRQ